jgi:hypothetical protein
MSDDFFDYWISDNNSICDAWEKAQIKWVYENGMWAEGLQPATMAANWDCLYETWNAASGSSATSGATIMLHVTVGEPEFFSDPTEE